MKTRTFNTLFMLSSLDGKISTGATDNRDTDKDFPKIEGISEGVKQYYDLEKRTDRVSFNTGRVMAKIGMNTNKCKLNCPGVEFVIVDSKHLTLNGVKNLIKKTKRLYLVTTNPKHPAFKVIDELELLFYPKKIDFNNLFKKFKQKYGMNRITIQSGGMMNSILLRAGLIDRVSIVVVPAIIGGAKTSTLVDGKDLFSEKDLSQIKTLKLVKCEKLKKSYLHLVYSVDN
jgi:2,5-diamino-6-(ribosylamino)-4(3H)-pyrimidinone 5'-phosphate reductase